MKRFRLFRFTSVCKILKKNIKKALRDLLTFFKLLQIALKIFEISEQRRIQAPVETSKMEDFAKIVNIKKLLIVFAKRSILDI